MALNAYLKLKGQKQGEIKGSVTQKGREGKIMVIAAHHEIISPRDAASGQAAGKHLHHPFGITKEVDRSSPLLYAAMIGNENLTEWELQFWRPAATGLEKQHYSVKLTNARVADIAFTMPNNKNPELAKLVEYEAVAFTYQKIQWTWVVGGLTAADDWMVPVERRRGLRRI
ncbi:MAG: Hcp family type VI secretion system effector [Burkholderiales bacterium]